MISRVNRQTRRRKIDKLPNTAHVSCQMVISSHPVTCSHRHIYFIYLRNFLASYLVTLFIFYYFCMHDGVKCCNSLWHLIPANWFTTAACRLPNAARLFVYVVSLLSYRRTMTYASRCFDLRRRWYISLAQFFFSQRVINVWNCLSTETVDFRSLRSFKRTIKLADFSSFLKCF